MAERQNGRYVSEHTATGTDQELCADGGGGRQVPPLHCQETGETYSTGKVSFVVDALFDWRVK